MIKTSSVKKSRSLSAGARMVALGLFFYKKTGENEKKDRQAMGYLVE
ncbi:MAG: hypothetical protein IKT58_05010 [Oscillospiraceae bacterium]|nr:hypothetical protein [Oscillospiraceae bacterium]